MTDFMTMDSRELAEEARTFARTSSTTEREKALLLALAYRVDSLFDLQFRPSGDNHHNAMLCPYCNPNRSAS